MLCCEKFSFRIPFPFFVGRNFEHFSVRFFFFFLILTLLYYYFDSGLIFGSNFVKKFSHGPIYTKIPCTKNFRRKLNAKYCFSAWNERKNRKQLLLIYHSVKLSICIIKSLCYEHRTDFPFGDFSTRDHWTFTHFSHHSSVQSTEMYIANMLVQTK